MGAMIPPLSPVPNDPLGFLLGGGFTYTADEIIPDDLQPSPKLSQRVSPGLGRTELDAGGPGWMPKVEVVVHGEPAPFNAILDEPTIGPGEILHLDPGESISLVEPSDQVQQ